MLFPLDSEALIVEYDGAYWHRGCEHGDRDKAEVLSECGLSFLIATVAPLPREQVPCRACCSLARRYRRAGSW